MTRDRIKTEVFRNVLIPHLVRPFARGEIKDVMLVIAVPEADEKDLGLDEQTLRLTPDSIPVLKLEPGTFSDLAMEYFDKCSNDPDYLQRNLDRSDWEGHVTRVTQAYTAKNTRWLPNFIQQLFDVIFPYST